MTLLSNKIFLFSSYYSFKRNFIIVSNTVANKFEHVLTLCVQQPKKKKKKKIYLNNIRTIRNAKQKPINTYINMAINIHIYVA